MSFAAASVCWCSCSVAVAADRSGCCSWTAGLLQVLLRHHFPFLYKNNIVLLMVLTAHQIPATVFPPSPAYFHSVGYFILGICKACFGPGETYCFISGCVAFMSMVQLSSGRGEDVALGFRLAAWLCCTELWRPPLCRAGLAPRGALQRRTA